MCPPDGALRRPSPAAAACGPAAASTGAAGAGQRSPAHLIRLTHRLAAQRDTAVLEPAASVSNLRPPTSCSPLTAL